MKVLFMAVLAVLLGLGSAVVSFAEEGQGLAGKDGEGKRRMGEARGLERHGEILKKFDKDGDGKLSDTEKAAAKAGMEARKAEFEKKLLTEFDKDGDGKLNDEERAAAKAAREAKGGEVRERIRAKFDKDGDGKLNDAEQTEARKFMEERKGKCKGGPKGERKPPAEAAVIK